MADKREVVDYLRNRQKAAEIEAKVNGINLWVLLGAIGVVGWTVLGSLDVHLSDYRETAVRVLLCAESAYLFSWLCGPTKGIRKELRFSSFSPGEMELPLLTVVEGLWLLIPPILHAALLGLSPASVFIGLIGLVFTSVGAVAVGARLLGVSGSSDQFPKPEFALSEKSDARADVFVGLSYILVAGWQVMLIAKGADVPRDAVRMIALFAAFYLLIEIAIRRRRSSHSIQWTYELETDILLDVVSPDTALRRIEHRALGARLEDVMNRFFEDLDRKISQFAPALATCETALQSVEAVPAEYPAERSARIEHATAEAKSLLTEMLADVQRLAQYLDSLDKKKSDKRVASALDALVVRKNAYKERLSSSSRKIDEMVSRARLISD